MNKTAEVPILEALLYIIAIGMLVCIILLIFTMPFAIIGYLVLSFLSLFDVGPESITYWASFVTGATISIISGLLSGGIFITNRK